MAPWIRLAAFGFLFAMSSAAHAQRSFVYSAYKDLTLAIDRDRPVITTLVVGASAPVVETGVTALSWAFAVGECGTETWSGLDAQKVADANVAAFDRSGVGYILSTGGALGVFSCASDEGMEKFIARYASPRLIGVDFDIEGAQSPELIDALVQRVKVAQRKRPALRFSFTLATLAASDGSHGSLNKHGDEVMRAISKHGITDYYINLMVMDYGDATPQNCVVVGGRCQMGQSAVQAARNLNAKYGVPLARIELTPMIGVNDVVANVFTPDDALMIARFVRDQKLAGLHFWSLDRDTPCAAGATAVSPTCSSLNGVPRLAFHRAFLEGLR